MFHVRWDVLYNLPFDATNHLVNEWNDNLPLKRSRDGQELPPAIGGEVCAMIDDGARKTAAAAGGGASAAAAMPAAAYVTHCSLSLTPLSLSALSL